MYNLLKGDEQKALFLERLRALEVEHYKHTLLLSEETDLTNAQPVKERMVAIEDRIRNLINFGVDNLGISVTEVPAGDAAETAQE